MKAISTAQLTTLSFNAQLYKITMTLASKHQRNMKKKRKKKKTQKELSVKSFVLRLKTRKRKQKNEDMFVCYLRDNQKKAKN